MIPMHSPRRHDSLGLNRFEKTTLRYWGTQNLDLNSFGISNGIREFWHSVSVCPLLIETLNSGWGVAPFFVASWID